MSIYNYWALSLLLTFFVAECSERSLSSISTNEKRKQFLDLRINTKDLDETESYEGGFSAPPANDSNTWVDFPTEDDEYLINRPIFFGIVTVSVFVFWFYNYWMQEQITQSF